MPGRNGLEGSEALLALIAMLGEVEGRKRIQKLVYLLQWLGAPLPQEFGFHFYGPYSEVLDFHLTWLRDTEVIAEVPARTRTAGFTTYRYAVTHNGRDAAERAEKSYAITSWRPAVECIVTQSPRFLELAATMAYLAARAPGEPRDVRAVKPEKNYTEDEIAAAKRFLADLRNTAA
jgi:uncharacterized protein YwgA